MAARERLTKPKLPAFDRGAKPQRKHVDEETVVRSFTGQGHAIVSLSIFYIDEMLMRLRLVES